MVTFREYEETALSTATHPALQDNPKMVLLLGLAGEVGELLGEYKKHLRDESAYSAFPERVEEELGDILWYITAAARYFGMSLQDLVDRNVIKITDRWSPGAYGVDAELPACRIFDEPTEERFPRQLEITIKQSEGAFGKVSQIFYNESQLGQDLTDNSYSPDGYRLHDIFHLSYMSVLGWSPIARFFLGLKRISAPAVAEVEDRGRGKVIDEGISALVFADAKAHCFYEGVHIIDHELLRLIRRMVSHLEVAVCSEREWQSAILQGYEAWRLALASNECKLSCDLDKRRLIATVVS